MPARSKRKGNPDVDKDGYPGPIGRGKGKKRGSGSKDPRIQDAEGLVAANEDELEGLRKGGADKATIRQYEADLAESRRKLKALRSGKSGDANNSFLLP